MQFYIVVYYRIISSLFLKGQYLIMKRLIIYHFTLNKPKTIILEGIQGESFAQQ